MIYNVVLKEEAEADVIEAYKYYKSRQNNLGERFLDELEQQIILLGKEPLIFQVRRKNYRFCPLKHFPFVIVYEIEKLDVVIYAVFNTYRNPSHLASRK